MKEIITIGYHKGEMDFGVNAGRDDGLVIVNEVKMSEQKERLIKEVSGMKGNCTDSTDASQDAYDLALEDILRRLQSV
jgi:hypothetical protein